MKTTIRNFRRSDRKGILHILAYYSRQSMAAYAEEDEDARYFKKLFKNPSRYPFYVIYSDDRLVGFGMLRPYSKLRFLAKRRRSPISFCLNSPKRELGGNCLKNWNTVRKNQGFVSYWLTSHLLMMPASIFT